MKFGVALPTGYEGLIFPPPFASPDSITRIAVAAEQMGFDSVLPNDHFSTQNYVRQMLPRPPNYFDPFVSLAYVAAQTRRIRLMTGVVVLPLRDPTSVAKQAASLDHFCQGRLVLGVGIGAYREEFLAVRPERRAWRRGDIVTDSIRAIRTLFEHQDATYHGQYFDFENVQMFPKPYQARLPIYVGGNAEANLQRAAELAEGWLPAIMSPSEIASGLERIRTLAAAAGRDLTGFEVAPQLSIALGRTQAEAEQKFYASHAYKHLVSLKNSTLKGQQGDSEARNLLGSASQVVDRIGHYAQAGVTEITGLIFCVDTVDEFLAGMEVFARDVIPQFKKDSAHA